jgi:N-acetylmuramate 1-kinase
MPFWKAKSMPDRAAEIDGFLSSLGWQQAERQALVADASARRYVRLIDENRRAMLMDAPPAVMSVIPFLTIARHLTGLGLSAPEVIGEDTERGLVLLEDFGDDTYNTLLRQTPEREVDLYSLAVDTLAHLHRFPKGEAVPAGIPAYSKDILLEEAERFILWYVPEMMGHNLTPENSETFTALWSGALDLALDQPRTLVLRDFHIDNLIDLKERSGVRRCGLLDFQDAVSGAGAYDLVSLLEDARRDIDVDLINDMYRRYVELMEMSGPERQAFDTAYAVLGAQRHTRIIGQFIRLCVRDAKLAYLVHIPRCWRLLEQSLCHPALSDLKMWFDTHIPKDKRGIPPKVRGYN